MKYRPQRSIAEFPVTVLVSGHSLSGKVVNISKAGARLLKIENLRAGDNVLLLLLHHRLTAVVRWASREYVGVQFTAPISDSILDLVTRNLQHRKRDKKVGFNFPEL